MLTSSCTQCADWEPCRRRYGLIPGDKDTGEVRQLCNAVDPDADLAALRSTADAAVRTIVCYMI